MKTGGKSHSGSVIAAQFDKFTLEGVLIPELVLKHGCPCKQKAKLTTAQQVEFNTSLSN